MNWLFNIFSLTQLRNKFMQGPSTLCLETVDRQNMGIASSEAFNLLKVGKFAAEEAHRIDCFTKSRSLKRS